MRRRTIPIAAVKISQKAKKLVQKVLDDNRLTYGPMTERFEKLLAKKIARQHAIFVNSGTSALMAALCAMKEAYGWSDGDEVLVPAVTFIASPNSIVHARLKPVFVDVEADYYCIDPSKIISKITKRTRAIMPVHLFGQSSRMEKIVEIASRYHLKIIEDCAETMFVSYQGKPVGTMGDVAVFSTYVAHFLTTGVGGIVVTDHDELARVVRSLIFHGRDSIYLSIDDDDDLKDDLRVTSLVSRRFFYPRLGFSMRSTEMEAALGLAGLTEIDGLMKKRRSVGEKLTQKLSDLANYLELPRVREAAQHAYMLYPLVIKNPTIDRDDLLGYLEKQGIETRTFMPVLTQPIYKKLVGDIEDQYPVAKKLVEQGFIIGCNPYMTKEDVEYIGEVLEKYLHK